LTPGLELLVAEPGSSIVFIEYTEQSFPVHHDILDGVQSLGKNTTSKVSDVSRVVEVEDILRI
jgi:hypothetical protein